MKKVNFVHCADLHLGCQQFNELERWQDFGDTFAEIVEYAIREKVDYVLISGDLFHHRSISAPTLGQAIKLLERLKLSGIAVIAIEGNHDKAFYLERDSWMHFLNQQGYIKLLKPEVSDSVLTITPYDGQKGCLLCKEGLRIIGLGYLGVTTQARLDEISSQIDTVEDFTVVMLHAAVDRLLGQDMAGVKLATFEGFKDKVDYFALGHIHSRYELGDMLYNPGAPECVHIDEEKEGKEKGFYHITFEGRDKEVKFISSSRRAVRKLAVDITGAEDLPQVSQKVQKIIEAADLQNFAQPIVQVVLYGTIDFSSYIIDTALMADSIKTTYDCLYVEVVNNANLPQIAGATTLAGFDRHAVERHVLGRMVAESKPEWKHMQTEMVDLILDFKQLILGKAPEKEIISAVERVLDNIPLAEVAVGIEGEQNHED